MKTTERSKRRYRPGRQLMMYARRYEMTTELEIPKLEFQRLVRDVCRELGTSCGFQAGALSALQGAAEYYLVDFFMDVNLSVIRQRRVMITPRDVALARRIRGRFDY